MIDTVLLCGNTDPENPYEQPIFLEQNRCSAEGYWEWLENELKNSEANFLLVGGHFPVYSIASHGNTNCLVQRLVPLLEKYHVSAYLSGHDHNIQHIQDPGKDWKVEYFVSGASDFIDTSTKHKDHIPQGSLKFHWGKFLSLGAFAYVETTETKMTLMFMEANEEILYTYSFPPRVSTNDI